MSAETLPQDTLGAAVLKTLAEEVKTAVDGGKGDLLGVMGKLKIKSLVAELPDGTEVATVTRAGGNATARDTDPGKFLAYVEENHPGEIVRAVRDSYQKALLEAIDKAGVIVDPESGEVVPGVEFKEGSPYLVITFARGEVGGRELIKQAWRAGQISLDSLLALPAPPAEEDEDGADSPLFMDVHGFLGPQEAAAYAMLTGGSGGFTTPPVEAYRMIRQGGIEADRARKWLAWHHLDPDDPHEGKRTPWPLPAPGSEGDE